MTNRGVRYTDYEKGLIASLIAQLGQTGVQRLMKRNGLTPATAVTLGKIAREYAIELERGPRATVEQRTYSLQEIENANADISDFNHYEQVFLAELVLWNGVRGTQRVMKEFEVDSASRNVLATVFHNIKPDGNKTKTPRVKSQPKVVTTSTTKGSRYSSREKAYLAALVDVHGLTGTIRTLKEYKTECPSIMTLSKIAKEYNVSVPRGRSAA